MEPMDTCDPPKTAPAVVEDINTPAKEVAERWWMPLPPVRSRFSWRRPVRNSTRPRQSYTSVGAGILAAADAVQSAELRLEQARKELADAEAGRTAPANRLATSSSDIRAMHREFEQRLTVE